MATFGCQNLFTQLVNIFYIILFYHCRHKETFLQNSTSMCSLWQKVCLRDDNEETSGHSHRRETVLLQSLWQRIHPKGQPEGKFINSKLLKIVQLLYHCQCVSILGT
jgi:hypothetical protein